MKFPLPLLSNGFERRTFPFFSVPKLSLASSTNFNSNSDTKSRLCYDRRSVGQCVILSNMDLETKTTLLLLNYWVMHPVTRVSIKYWNNLSTQQSIF
jgi:hypothetical protein